MLHEALTVYWVVVVVVVLDAVAWGALYARAHDRGWSRGFADGQDDLTLGRR